MSDCLIEMRLYTSRQEELISWLKQEQLARQCQGYTQGGLKHWLVALLKGWPFDPIDSSTTNL